MSLEYDASDAPLWQIIANIQGILEGLEFAPMGDDGMFTLSPGSIEVQKASGEGETDQVANLPGLLITLPGEGAISWEGGTTSEMEPVYPILIQILDRDNARTLEGLRSYLKWQNQIVRALSMPEQCLIDPETEGVTYEVSQAVGVMSVDERKWKRHQLFVCGVIVQVMTRETVG